MPPAPSPPPRDLQGVWRMDVISNANHAGGVAYLSFDAKPDGRLACRYLLMGLMEGLVLPSFLQDHFQMNDFTPFHDEIRKVAERLPGGQIRHGHSTRRVLRSGQSLAGNLPFRLRRQFRLLLHADANR